MSNQRFSGMRQGEKGAVFFYIFIAIMVLAMLTYAVSQYSQQQTDVMDIPKMDQQIGLLFSQMGAVATGVNTMLIKGEDPATLYSSLDTDVPGDAGWDTAPHTYKIFHPLGGGITYMENTGDTSSSATVATDIIVSPESIVEGVGATDVTIGDILFVATITSEAACARINEKLTGSNSIPVLQTAMFNDLIAGTAVTITSAQCADCEDVPKICVSNTGNTAWAFYATLLPG